MHVTTYHPNHHKARTACENGTRSVAVWPETVVFLESEVTKEVNVYRVTGDFSVENSIGYRDSMGYSCTARCTDDECIVVKHHTHLSQLTPK